MRSAPLTIVMLAGLSTACSFASATQQSVTDMDVGWLLQAADAAVRDAGALEFEFSSFGTGGMEHRVEGWSGRALVAPPADGELLRLRLRAAGRGPAHEATGRSLHVVSDGEWIDVIDGGSRSHVRGRLLRDGSRMWEEYDVGVAPAFSVENRYGGFLGYRPRRAGDSVVRGEPCVVVELLFPGGGWRWHFGVDDLLLRREERLESPDGVDGARVLELWNVRPTSSSASAFDAPEVPAGFSSEPYGPAGPAIGDMAPDWPPNVADGSPLSLADLRGRVVVLEFWATWCAPCVKTMPHLQALFEEFRTDGLEVVGATWNESGDPQEYAEQIGVRYPIVPGDGIAGDYGIDEYGIPTLFVIGRDGRIVDFSVGYHGAQSESWLRRTVTAALDSNR